jgi:hypothetical protein
MDSVLALLGRVPKDDNSVIQCVSDELMKVTETMTERQVKVKVMELYGKCCANDLTADVCDSYDKLCDIYYRSADGKVFTYPTAEQRMIEEALPGGCKAFCDEAKTKPDYCPVEGALSTEAIIGIVLASLGVLALIVIIIVFCCDSRKSIHGGT